MQNDFGEGEYGDAYSIAMRELSPHTDQYLIEMMRNWLLTLNNPVMRRRVAGRIEAGLDILCARSVVQCKR